MIKVGIIGATGYVGVELFRLLLNHPMVEVFKISSKSYLGQSFSSIYKNFLGKTTLICEDSETVINSCDLIFIALPHGLSESLAEKTFYKDKICIDLGADFRLSSEENYITWYNKSFDKPKLHQYSIYGLPELNRETIKQSKIIANPGCFPTSINLALMPLLKNSLIYTDSIICDSKSGITGAGRSLSLGSHFPEANENFNPYKIGSHRHTPEIEEVLSFCAREEVSVTFTPHLLPINRGILSTIYVKLKESLPLETIHKLYKGFYKNEPFINILPLNEAANIKDIKLTNNCNISLHFNYKKDTLIIVSAIDNMIKGAAGQAIQNMNLVLGLPEDLGLKLTSPSF